MLNASLELQTKELVFLLEYAYIPLPLDERPSSSAYRSDAARLGPVASYVIGLALFFDVAFAFIA